MNWLVTETRLGENENWQHDVEMEVDVNVRTPQN